MKPYIVIVEDEESIATMLQYNLEKEGFDVAVAEDGEQGLFLLEEKIPDLMVLDWMLPIYDGIEVCKRIRENDETRQIPVLMLTARGEEADRVRGLDSGADDYMVKPFSPKELIARIHAILRRTRPVLEDKKLEFNGIEIDLKSHKVFYGKYPIHLGPTEFRLLTHLMEHTGQVFSREQLLDSVWGRESYLETRTVDVHIRRLRKALESINSNLGSYIRTVRSAGYVLEDPDIY